MNKKLSFDEFQRRIIGVLIEKSLALPQYYPMTISAIVTACNQKNNRNPVMELDEEVVWRTLNELREIGLVVQVMPAVGSRTEKYKHSCFEYFGWEKRDRAVMAELLLRGPQTVGELRTRCSRMVEFDSIQAMQLVIDHLASMEDPFLMVLPREAGQSAVRYTHCLYPDDEMPAASSLVSHVNEPADNNEVPDSHTQKSSNHDVIESMHTKLTELQGQVEVLTKRLENLEKLVE